MGNEGNWGGQHIRPVILPVLGLAITRQSCLAPWRGGYHDDLLFHSRYAQVGRDAGAGDLPGIAVAAADVSSGVDRHDDLLADLPGRVGHVRRPVLGVVVTFGATQVAPIFLVTAVVIANPAISSL